MSIIDKIRSLEEEMNTYKDKICLHEEVFSNGYSAYYGGNIYICDNCGKVFVSEVDKA